MSTYYLTHTSTANRKVTLHFNSEAEAKLWAYRMRRSPKTKAVVYREALPQWPLQLKTFTECPKPFEQVKPYRQNPWFRVSAWLTATCRIVWRTES